MRFHWRPLIPGETDPELLWGSVLGVSALIASAWFCSGIPTPLCPLHTFSGFPCPTCGTTRASAAILHGELAAAFVWNPLATLILSGVILYVLYAVVVVIGKLPRLRWTPPTSKEAGWIRISVILLVAANWAYLFWRGV